MNGTGQRVLRAFIAPLVVLGALCASAPASAQPPLSAPLDPRQPQVERYTYAIALPDTGKHITVSALVRLAAKPALDTVVFNLDDAMRVSSVRFACDSVQVLARFVRTPELVKVVIPVLARISHHE